MGYRYREMVGLAWLVRGLCVDFALSERSCEYDFHGDMTLACMCAVASMVLRKASGDKFKVLGGTFSIEENRDPHCWCEYGPWTLDITASQFGVGIPVLILRNENSNKYYRNGVLMNRYKDFNWGHTQNPTPRLTRVILNG